MKGTGTADVVSRSRRAVGNNDLKGQEVLELDDDGKITKPEQSKML
jgi:hypothetical protein